MSGAPQQQSYIVFPLGERSYALPAEVVVELSRRGAEQEFPHTTPHLAGVLVRRGTILPVWNIAPTLLGADLPARKFYLVVLRHFSSAVEWTAIPVSGECQMVHAVPAPPLEGQPAYIRGSLLLESGSVEVLDLDALAAFQRAAPAGSRPGGEG